MFFNLKEKYILNEKINDININLENNYKDLAISAYNDFAKTLEEMKQNGLNEKVYNKYKKILDDFTKRMEGYSHRDFYHS